MKVIIAGSRNISDISLVSEAVEKAKTAGIEITEVVSGTAKGVDKLGEEWAKNNNIPIKLMPADWDTHGKSAGYKRNQAMADYADALIAIWDGESKGTGHMIDIAKKKGIKGYVKVVRRV